MSGAEATFDAITGGQGRATTIARDAYDEVPGVAVRKRKSAPKTCRDCGQRGHNRRTCTGPAVSDSEGEA